MSEVNWFRDLPFAITICDTEGVILEMNDAAEELFRADGGRALIGRNVFDCHPEPARRKLREMMASQKRNIYTVEKDGRKHLVYQSPWYRQGQYAGFLELMMEVPFDMPHFTRS